jgi:hypothetical protein
VGNYILGIETSLVLDVDINTHSNTTKVKIGPGRWGIPFIVTLVMDVSQ